MNRYIYRYKISRFKNNVAVIFGEDIYKAREEIIKLIGGECRLISCHKLYNPNFCDEPLD